LDEREYIRTMPVEELLPMVKAELRANKLWREEYDEDDRDWLLKVLDLISPALLHAQGFLPNKVALISPMISISLRRPSAKNLKKESRLKNSCRLLRII